MSHLLPMLYSDWWEDLDRSHHLLGQNFGHGLRHDDVLVPHIPTPAIAPHHILQQYITPIGGEKPRNTLYLRPWVQSHKKGHGGVSTVKADKDQFQIALDIQQFSPEEITVKVVGKFVVVEGKHEEKQDEHGWISRQFTRKYLVPEQCDIEQVKSTLSLDGVLTITVPRKHDPKVDKEKLINIEFTGKPMVLANGESKKEKKKEEMKEKEDKKPENK